MNVAPTLKMTLGNVLWCLLSVILFFSASQAADIYVDNSIGSTITNGKYSAAQRDASGSDGNAYRTIKAAINAMNPGDDIYIRNGVYREGAIIIPPSKSGTSNNWSSIQSYTGEWAVIDAEGKTDGKAGVAALGYRTQAKRDDSTYLKYWRFERLEITGGSNYGLAASGGPIVVRYCYVHDNINSSNCGDNPGGIHSTLMRESIIEYNVFDKNGCYDKSDKHPAHIQIISDYAYMTSYGVCDDGKDFTWATGLCHEDFAIKKNKIRYNLFANSDGRNVKGFHHKSHMVLTPHRAKPDTPDSKFKDWGDEIHNNIFLDQYAFSVQQDFIQFHHNILDGSNLSVRDSKQEPPEWFTGYNNSVIGRNIRVNYANDGDGSPSGSVRRNNPHWASEDITITGFLFNNIIDGYSKGEVSQGIDIGEWMQDADYDNGDVDFSDFHVSHNYYYRGNSYMFYNLEGKSGECFGSVTKDKIESCYATFNNNYEKQTSEGADSLYQAASGADRYKTRGAHAVGDGRIVNNSGYGRPHPYLNNTSIPAYIGATNPSKDSGLDWDPINADLNDSGWVDYVLSLNNVETLKSGKPATVNDSPSDDDVDAPILVSPPTGLRIVSPSV
jgi:hypothetical protein